jgi:hypothetical protein
MKNDPQHIVDMGKRLEEERKKIVDDYHSFAFKFNMIPESYDDADRLLLAIYARLIRTADGNM